MRELVAYWTDAHGKRWAVPRIKGRLKPGKVPGHAALRAFIIERDNGRCKLCGAAAEDTKLGCLVVDHIVSRRNGGSHHPSNLRALCDPCNASKAGSEDRGRPLKIKRLGIGARRRDS